ncbi:hypothetical protein B0H10DRAFT_2220162 [Mycena sp. CBHHK59/15]|nr:hypothetical protein B0H10DRAFT_2220162 [Mycena sp. CBHHK59/15]
MSRHLPAGTPWLGTSIAPVTTSAGKLAINPKNKAALRYNGLSENQQKALGSTTIEQILRPLSYALNFSPLLAFTAEKDLQNLHIDLNTQLQMRGLLSSRSGEALIYMEHILFSLIKATCVATRVDTVMKSDFKTLRDAMPSQSHAGTALFTAVFSRFATASTSSVPVLPPRSPPRPVHIHPLHPPLQPTHKYSVIQYQEPRMNIDYTTRGPLARALSQAPHNHGHPANTMMTLYSDLDPISQTELVGKKGLLRLDAPAPIAEPVPEKSSSREKMEIDVEVEEQPVVEGSALEDAMQVDVAAPPSPIILVVLRKSLRLQEPRPPPVIVDSEVPASATKATRKRKSKGSQGGTKKRIKDTDEVANDDGDEDESSGEEEEGDRTDVGMDSKEGDQTHVGLDTEWTDNARPGVFLPFDLTNVLSSVTKFGHLGRLIAGDYWEGILLELVQHPQKLKQLEDEYCSLPKMLHPIAQSPLLSPLLVPPCTDRQSPIYRCYRLYKMGHPRRQVGRGPGLLRGLLLQPLDKTLLVPSRCFSVFILVPRPQDHHRLDDDELNGNGHNEARASEPRPPSARIAVSSGGSAGLPQPPGFAWVGVVVTPHVQHSLVHGDWTPGVSG